MLCKSWKSGGPGVVKASMRSVSERIHGFELPASQAMIGAAVLCCGRQCIPFIVSFHIYTFIGTLSFCFLAFVLGSHSLRLLCVLMYIPSFHPVMLASFCAIFHTSVPSTCISYALFTTAASIPFQLLGKRRTINHLSIPLYFSFESRLLLNKNEECLHTAGPSPIHGKGAGSGRYQQSMRVSRETMRACPPNSRCVLV